MSYQNALESLVGETHQSQQVFQCKLANEFDKYSPENVQWALKAAKGNLQALKVLLSPAAEAFIEQMAQQSAAITRQRFGANINLFIPLYLSNLCANECDYCGFSMSNKVKRKVLDEAEIKTEVEIIKKKGFDSVLLVTGEHQTKVGMAYFEQMLPLIRAHFSYLAMEVQPLDQADYQRLVELGLNAVMVYQETYCKRTYQEHHLRGNKTDFNYRLATPERLSKAGVDKIGLGVLLGLANWRNDAWMMGHHLAYMQKHHWRSRYSISVPRLRPCKGGIQPKYLISDKQLLQLICAFRLFSPDLEISISTRESAAFRNGVFPLGVTHASAESVTEPGGYAQRISLHTDTPNGLPQFEISDERSLADIIKQLREQHLQPVLKDWQVGW